MERILDALWSLGRSWQSWTALFAICVGLEAVALYYQEALFYFPCELCVYTRVWIAAMALVALAGLALRRKPWAVRAVLAGEILLSLGLAGVVWKLLALDYGFAPPGACKLEAQFPSWAPLDDWFPMMFRVQDSCGVTPDVLFGLSMADGLAAITVALLVAFTLGLVGSFRPPRRQRRAAH